MTAALPDIASLPMPVLALGLAVLGAVFGSFIAAIVIRWPQDRSVLRGRSACDACGAPLHALDLVPIVSAIVVHGKCRRCGQPIDSRHWWIEGAALIIGALAGALLPGGSALAAAVFGWLLLALAALDITEYWLPDRLTLTLAGAGVASGLLGVAPPIADRLIGGLAGFGALWLIGAAYRRLRGREGLGGGDPKLLGAIGLWMGWALLPVTVLLASLIGLGVVLWWLLSGRGARADDRLPFGALLAIAAYVTELAMLGNAG